MGKACMLFVLMCVVACTNASLDTALSSAAIQDAIRDMRDYTPNAVIPSYNESPPESQLNVSEDGGERDELMIAGRHRAESDPTSRFIATQDIVRKKETPNPGSDEVLVGERLIDASESTNLSKCPDGQSGCVPVGCADGACDTTQADVSDDMNEGFSRLGALAGTADDVRVNQTQSGQATIFKGVPIKCASYPWGTRDCCTDDGFLDGLISCPASMQVLQRAKNDQRVIPLGSYKPHRLSKEVYHVYCVFPTKLARIIQFYGRQGQLHKWFGNPKHPDCSGLTPEQLERINFEILNLSEFIQDVKNKTRLPADNAGVTPNEGHVEAMFHEGRAHD